jgi:predicted dehydrogenase
MHQEVIIPDVVLVGRNETKLKALCKRTGIEKWTTDLDSVLNDSSYTRYILMHKLPADVRMHIQRQLLKENIFIVKNQ